MCVDWRTKCILCDWKEEFESHLFKNCIIARMAWFKSLKFDELQFVSHNHDSQIKSKVLSSITAQAFLSFSLDFCKGKKSNTFGVSQKDDKEISYVALGNGIQQNGV